MAPADGGTDRCRVAPRGDALIGQPGMQKRPRNRRVLTRPADDGEAASGRISLRLPPGMLSRVDALVPGMIGAGEAVARGRSVVLRAVIAEGLRVVEMRQRRR